MWQIHEEKEHVPYAGRSHSGLISRVTTNCEKSAEPIVVKKFL